MRGSHLSGQGMATKRFSLFLLRLRRASDAARAAQTDDFFKERRQANHVMCV